MCVTCRIFCGATNKLVPAWFWGPNQESGTVILRHKSPNRSYRFWGSNRKTHRSWFWGQTNKYALLISLCTVQTTHSITRSPDRSVIEYPTCAYRFQSSTPGLLLLTRSSSLPVISHLSPTYYETSKYDSPHKIDSSRTTKMSWIRIQPMTCKWLIAIKSIYWQFSFSERIVLMKWNMSIFFKRCEHYILNSKLY
jgi:hypothetical protein